MSCFRSAAVVAAMVIVSGCNQNQDQVDQLSGDLTAAQAALAAAQTKIAQYDRGARTREVKLADANNKLADAVDRTKSLVTAVSDQAAKLAAQANELTALKAIKVEFEKFSVDGVKQIKQMASANNALQQQIAAQGKTQLALKAQNQKLVDQIKGLRQDIQKLQNLKNLGGLGDLLNPKPRPQGQADRKPKPKPEPAPKP